MTQPYILPFDVTIKPNAQPSLTQLNYNLVPEKQYISYKMPVREVIQHWRETTLDICKDRVPYLHVSRSTECDDKIIIYKHVLRVPSQPEMAMSTLIIGTDKALVVKDRRGNVIQAPFICSIIPTTTLVLPPLPNAANVPERKKYWNNTEIAAYFAISHGMKLTFLNYVPPVGNVIGEFVAGKVVGGQVQMIPNDKALATDFLCYRTHPGADIFSKSTIILLSNIIISKDRLFEEVFEERDYLFLYHRDPANVTHNYCTVVEKDGIFTTITIFLVSKNLSGRLYENGYFVREEKRLRYGYNSTNMHIDKHKELEHPSTTSWIIRAWIKGCCEREDVLSIFWGTLMGLPNCLEAQHVSSIDYSIFTSEAVVKITDLFFVRYPNCFPYNGGRADKVLANLAMDKETVIIPQPLLKILYLDERIREWVYKARETQAILLNNTPITLSAPMKTQLLDIEACIRSLVSQEVTVKLRIHTNAPNAALGVMDKDSVVLNEICLRDKQTLVSNLCIAYHNSFGHTVKFFNHLLACKGIDIATRPIIHTPEERIKKILKRKIDEVDINSMGFETKEENKETSVTPVSADELIKLMSQPNKQVKKYVTIKIELLEDEGDI